MGFFSKLFGGGGGGDSGAVTAQPLMPSWQSGLGEDLSNWVRRYLQLYNPGESYPGQLSVKTPTEFETTGLGELGTLLGKPATGDLFGAAKTQLLDTLGGKFADPQTSPFIQSMQKYAGQNLQDAIGTARGQRGARGNYFHTAGLKEESNLSERTQNFLNTQVGDFINKERGRQLTAVPFAQDLESYGELEAPLKRVAASQTLGSFPRLLEQADLERQYADYKRGRSELSAVPGVGNAVFGRQVPYVFNAPTQEPGGLQAILQTLGSVDLFGGSRDSGGFDSKDWKSWMDLAIKILPMILA